MSERYYPGGGAMTGATGDLVFEDPAIPFVPAETKEIADPDHQAAVTTTQTRHGPAQSAGAADPAERQDGDPTGPAPHDGGYGSTHGLGPNDPAYRMEQRPSTPEPEDRKGSPPVQRRHDTYLGGDERRSPEDEHF